MSGNARDLYIELLKNLWKWSPNEIYGCTSEIYCSMVTQMVMFIENEFVSKTKLPFVKDFCSEIYDASVHHCILYSLIAKLNVKDYNWIILLIKFVEIARLKIMQDYTFRFQAEWGMKNDAGMPILFYGFFIDSI